MSSCCAQGKKGKKGKLKEAPPPDVFTYRHAPEYPYAPDDEGTLLYVRPSRHPAPRRLVISPHRVSASQPSASRNLAGLLARSRIPWPHPSWVPVAFSVGFPCTRGCGLPATRPPSALRTLPKLAARQAKRGAFLRSAVCPTAPPPRHAPAVWCW